MPGEQCGAQAVDAGVPLELLLGEGVHALALTDADCAQDERLEKRLGQIRMLLTSFCLNLSEDGRLLFAGRLSIVPLEA